jgi:uncharacterized membrane protein
MMMHLLKVFLATTAVLFVIDYLWLGVLMSGFYKAELGSLGRMEGGALKPVIWAAVVVYVLIPLGIVLFALPRVQAESPIASALLWGFIFGVVLYGVYDMTNYALIANWPARMMAVDMVWGGVLCALGTLVASYADRMFS